MCLTNNHGNTQRFLEKNKGKSYVILYKVVTVREDNITAPYYSEYEYRGGWNRSDATYSEIPFRYNYPIEKGIHVCLTQKRAIVHKTSGDAIIKVRCHLKDLIGVNGHSHEAVFTKVWVPKSEIEKV